MYISLGLLLLLPTIAKARRKDLGNVRLSKNFTLSEMIRTSYPVDNTPKSPIIIENLSWLVNNILQPLRDYFGKPIIVTSGYRSPKLNSMLKFSVPNSKHMYGQAADIKISGVPGSEIVKAARKLNLPFDTIIDEALFDEKGNLHTHTHIVGGKKLVARRRVLLARNEIGNLKPKYINV